MIEQLLLTRQSDIDLIRQLFEFNARFAEHFFGCDVAVCAVVFIRFIDDLLDPGLDDRLGAFIAREQGYV